MWEQGRVCGAGVSVQVCEEGMKAVVGSVALVQVVGSLPLDAAVTPACLTCPCSCPCVHTCCVQDQPINTGFSYSADDRDRCYDEACVSDDM